LGKRRFVIAQISGTMRTNQSIVCTETLSVFEGSATCARELQRI
jgi:hypothetical protein